MVTGSSYYNIYVNGVFSWRVGPARAAWILSWMSCRFVWTEEWNEIKIVVMGYACNSFYHTDEPSFLTAESISEKWSDCIYRTKKLFPGFEWVGKGPRKVQRYSFQRPFVEVYDFYERAISERVSFLKRRRKKYLPRGVFYGVEYETEPAVNVIQKGSFSISEKQQYYNDRFDCGYRPETEKVSRGRKLTVFSTTEAQSSIL